MSGIGKQSQKPYSMLICSGIFTNEDGTMEVGEMSFMEGVNRPLPTHLVPGQAYTPVLGCRARDGKLSFEITELKPLVAAQAVKAA